MIDAHYNMAILLAKKKNKIDEAVKECRRVLEIDPNHTGARQALEAFTKTAADKK
jgi:tetratricopeptide (TPR) repeat protein